MTKNITCERHWVGTNANIEYYYLIILLSKTKTERNYLTENKVCIVLMHIRKNIHRDRCNWKFFGRINITSRYLRS